MDVGNLVPDTMTSSNAGEPDRADVDITRLDARRVGVTSILILIIIKLLLLRLGVVSIICKGCIRCRTPVGDRIIRNSKTGCKELVWLPLATRINAVVKIFKRFIILYRPQVDPGVTGSVKIMRLYYY